MYIDIDIDICTSKKIYSHHHPPPTTIRHPNTNRIPAEYRDRVPT